MADLVQLRLWLKNMNRYALENLIRSTLSFVTAVLSAHFVAGKGELEKMSIIS